MSNFTSRVIIALGGFLLLFGFGFFAVVALRTTGRLEEIPEFIGAYSVNSDSYRSGDGLWDCAVWRSLNSKVIVSAKCKGNLIFEMVGLTDGNDGLDSSYLTTSSAKYSFSSYHAISKDGTVMIVRNSPGTKPILSVTVQRNGQVEWHFGPEAEPVIDKQLAPTP